MFGPKRKRGQPWIEESEAPFYTLRKLRFNPLGANGQGEEGKQSGGCFHGLRECWFAPGVEHGTGYLSASQAVLEPGCGLPQCGAK